jgi:hypothetical protein
MQSNLLITLSVKDLKRAVAIRERIDGLQRDLDRITGAQAAPAKNGASRRKKGKMSTAARARISAGMKARWAKRRGNARVQASNGQSKNSDSERSIEGADRPNPEGGREVRDHNKGVAAKLGKSYGNISVWFHTTAKGIKEIKKSNRADSLGRLDGLLR